MKMNCPHCGIEFSVANPFTLPDELLCLQCGGKVWLEIDEGEEGPLFTLLRQPPSCELFPPKEDAT